ncbi:MAG TPA: S-methyl-5-thioribose-1-phosphate isomerase [Solirubrobacteraceae bacterium]|nr:S-methyl-5-thioribose-1-phosphate isomerase [Solirubrobacteraceae bacterium]
MATTLSPPPLRWDGERLHVLDQTRLPAEEVVLVLERAEDTAQAIERLSVRGAPLIGVAAAFGLAMELARAPSLGALERGAERLATCRPTARNLAWAVERVRAAALAAGPVRMAGAARVAAEEIQRSDAAASAALSEHGAALLDAALPRVDASAPITVLTHCNSGCLAASGRGTGLGVIAALADRRPVRVLACEARPLLQGARLTVWELGRLGIEHALLVDAAAPGLIRTGQVDAVVTGFDRVAANGDVANKVGTYGLALAAHAAGIPFVAAGPSSSLDAALPDGDAIEIEERGGDEVRAALGTPLTVPGTPVRNPAFDVTPAALVWALVTERGVAQPVDAAAVAAVA